MNRRWSALALSMVGIGGAAGVARASPSSRLVYSRATGAAGCATEAELRKAVAARVGYDPFFAWAKRTIVARMLPHDSGFEATVSLVDEDGLEHGARILRTGGPCGDLLEATALAIAIAIDPSALTPPPAAAVAPAPAPVPAPALEPAPTPAVGPAPAPASFDKPAPTPASGLDLAAGAVASAGVAPGVAAGVSVDAGWWWNRVSVALEGRIDAPSVALPAQGGGWVSSWIAAGGLVPCVRLEMFAICAIGQIGSLQSRSNVVRSGSGALWAAAGGRFALVVPLDHRFSFRLRSDLLVDLARPTLILNEHPAWTAPLFASSFGIDVDVHFR